MAFNPFNSKKTASTTKNSKIESKRVSVVDDYSSPDVKSNEFISLKKNARYIMFQCQKDHFVKESNNLNR